ncbi:RluA family pseudouridine synthase [Oligoflexaceae bacterium]|nr:RluA family pseudouridine synthase [Oligoflexaceae bacterium]
MQIPEDKRENVIAEDLRRLGQDPINEFEAGKRLDYHLSHRFPFFTRSRWQKRISQGQLLINQSAMRKAAYRLQEGDRISMYYPRRDEPQVDCQLPLLVECEGVLGVFKPAGLPMHENGLYHRNTFAQALIEQYGPQWAAVHRIDRETSGVVICGNTHEIRSDIAKSLAEREVLKSYLAITEGRVSEDHFSCDAPLGEPPLGSEIRIKKWVNHDDGLESLTDFDAVDRCLTHSLVRAFPKTGRTNQIRIHLAFLGHRIVGDKLYHPDEQVFLNYYERDSSGWVEEMAGFPRHCLHAESFSFTHPVLKRPFRVEAPMPADMQNLWDELEGG